MVFVQEARLMKPEQASILFTFLLTVTSAFFNNQDLIARIRIIMEENKISFIFFISLYPESYIGL